MESSLPKIDLLIKWVDAGEWPSVPVNSFTVDDEGMAELIRQLRLKTSVVLSTDRLRMIRSELAALTEEVERLKEQRAACISEMDNSQLHNAFE